MNIINLYIHYYYYLGSRKEAENYIAKNKNSVKEKTLGPFQSELEFENRLEGKNKVAKKEPKKKVREYVVQGISKRLEKIQKSSEKNPFVPPTSDIPSFIPPTSDIPSFIPPTSDIPSYVPPSNTQKSTNETYEAAQVHPEDTMVMTAEQRDQLILDWSDEVYEYYSIKLS